MRVHFLVDGFNLYHSIKAADRRLGSGPLRWLGLAGMFLLPVLFGERRLHAVCSRQRA